MNPHFEWDSKDLAVQRMATKMVRDLKVMTQDKMLRELGLGSLAKRLTGNLVSVHSSQW